MRSLGRSRHGSLRPRTDPGTIGEIDRGIEDHLIAAFDAAVDLNLAAEIAHHTNLAQMDDAVLDNGDLHPALSEDDGVGGNP